MIPVDDYKIVLDGNIVGTILDGKEASVFCCPIDNNAHKIWLRLGDINSSAYVIPDGTLDCPLIARHSSKGFTLFLDEKKAESILQEAEYNRIRNSAETQEIIKAIEHCFGSGTASRYWSWFVFRDDGIYYLKHFEYPHTHGGLRIWAYQTQPKDLEAQQFLIDMCVSVLRQKYSAVDVFEIDATSTSISWRLKE